MSLILKGISHQFDDVAAVYDAHLEVAAGEIMCLFGPSGCGKTTLLRIAAGLENIQAGAIELGGKEIARPGREAPPEDRAIGFVFQDFVLFPHMTVEQNIAFGIAGMKGAKAIIAAQLDAMQLSEKAARYPHELSGGEQQRVALARALVRNPEALLLDEPFAAIDATLRRRLREDLHRVLKEQNVAVVLVTHDPEEALALGDRIALMRHGHIVETAAPEELFSAPQSFDGAKIFPGSQTVSGAIKNGQIETALGTFAAPGLGDGPGIAIMREGALSIESGGNAEGFVVTDCRFTGPGWTAYLRVSASRDLIRVRMAAPLQIGARVSLSIDPGQIFIFVNQ
ncbi:MAG: ABC transporter ATP-binding protein [Alphaproteobacteria bacterium]|nr:ABC transporter ATP-binding protein [Alphaproteobacteria bacterium]